MGAAQAEEFHRPVLVEAVCGALGPALASGPKKSRPRRYVDLTLGGGGHAKAVLERFAPEELWAFDRDREALAAARAKLEGLGADTRLELIHAPFSEADAHLRAAGVEQVDAVLADLGVSSWQLDAIERGFSFRGDAPLDMRMDQSRGPSAAELLESLDAAALARILREYGEEPDAERIARAIVEKSPRSTLALALCVRDAMSHRQLRKLGARVNPATRTFQALRIAVNAEFDEIDAMLATAPSWLAPGGRLGVISFHSLEDARVKRAFRGRTRVEAPPAGLPVPARDLPQADFEIPRGLNKGVDADADETAANPRARSARLRVLARKESPA